MTPEDKAMFCKLLMGAAELYSKPLEPAVIEIYWNVLEKYPLERIKQALNLHVRNIDNGQFMPKPADILRYIEVSNKTKALYAWDKVIAAMNEYGAYDSITFDDPIIHVVISEMQGWIRVCRDEHKNPSLAQEFHRRYMIYLLYPPSSAPQHLAGRFECQNRLHGFEKYIPKPIPFGDKEMKLLISNYVPEVLQKLEKSNDSE